MDEGNTFGSPRLPTDPPLELSGMPAAQAAWIWLVTSNPALRDLDADLVREFCKLVEELGELQRMIKASDPESDIYLRLSDRLAGKKEFMRTLYRDMFPGDPGNMPEFDLGE